MEFSLYSLHAPNHFRSVSNGYKEINSILRRNLTSLKIHTRIISDSNVVLLTLLVSEQWNIKHEFKYYLNFSERPEYKIWCL